MIVDLESQMISRLSAALLPKVSDVQPMPNLEGNALLSKFQVDAPAIYVSVRGGPIQWDRVDHNVGILVVVKNAAGPEQAREGTAVDIGLYPLLDAIIALLNNGWVPGARPVSYSIDDDAVFVANGLVIGQVGAVMSTNTDPIPEPILAMPAQQLQLLLKIDGFIDVNGYDPTKTPQQNRAAAQETFNTYQAGTGSPAITSQSTPEQSS